MKKVLIDFLFPNDYYDIHIDYTSVDYKSVYSYEKKYFQNMKGQLQNQIIIVKSMCKVKERV